VKQGINFFELEAIQREMKIPRTRKPIKPHRSNLELRKNYAMHHSKKKGGMIENRTSRVVYKSTVAEQVSGREDLYSKEIKEGEKKGGRIPILKERGRSLGGYFILLGFLSKAETYIIKPTTKKTNEGEEKTTNERGISPQRKIQGLRMGRKTGSERKLK